MTCIKTGCIVHFANYGTTISADVFRVANALVIRTHADQLDSEKESWAEDRAQLQVLSSNSDNEFWRVDLGVFVVDEKRCATWLVEPHP